MSRVLVLSLAMASACAGGPNTCRHADETTYRSCMPLIVTMEGCVGGPRGGDRMTAHVYPIGCQVDVPECSELDPGIPRTFECMIGAGGQPDWYEPI